MVTKTPLKRDENSLPPRRGVRESRVVPRKEWLDRDIDTPKWGCNDDGNTDVHVQFIPQSLNYTNPFLPTSTIVRPNLLEHVVDVIGVRLDLPL